MESCSPTVLYIVTLIKEKQATKADPLSAAAPEMEGNAAEFITYYQLASHVTYQC